MRRFIPILLTAVILSLGSGALEYVHNLAHALEDALEDRQAAAEFAAAASNPGPASPVSKDATLPSRTDRESDHHHDESNCPMHAKLHMAIHAGEGLCPPLPTGQSCLSQSELTPQWVAYRLIVRQGCRGPPFIAA